MGCELFADDLRPDRTSRGRLESVLLADLNSLPQPAWSLQRGFLANGGDDREDCRTFRQDSHELRLGRLTRAEGALATATPPPKDYRSVICVTSSQGELWLNDFMRWTAARSRNGGGSGDETMFRNSAATHMYDQGMIDDRNLRPLAIAFVTILAGWMLAFGLFFASSQIGVQSRNLADRPASVVSATVK